MNYHCFAPKRYKRLVIAGFVYRIFRACSDLKLFHSSLERAKTILERNQYPPAFYEPIIKEALNNIKEEGREKQQEEQDKEGDNATETVEGTQNGTTAPKQLLFVQYRGKATEDFARALHKAEAPCTIVFTLRKLRSVLPSLKPSVPKNLRGSVVYKLKCPRCAACYVGQTDRHFCTRLKEHQQKKDQPVYKHFKKCRRKLTLQDTEILTATTRSVTLLETLEALWIEELKPGINTKEEYKQRHLTIRLSSGL